ncbi:Histidine kinase-, DNA gyrase B-, and HSP90-like ATPase [Anaerobium acetethylicum]|uniref:Histidine kinase-, DNA gyrase B-, and HSP90-like ATPase n=2 Tax=Anaerobium acetethylicum TaxID=1619234 RepID=A0A1D3TTR4_9FIRM|nr:Histidine kinase-, DNA gyrase B-, and HSP90-like ATPase [Anaerobium acetethylicum]
MKTLALGPRVLRPYVPLRLHLSESALRMNMFCITSYRKNNTSHIRRKESIMKEKRFRSIIREVIILPLLVMGAIIIITIAACIISYQNMEDKMVDSNFNSLQIALSQMDNLLAQVDQDFIRYVTTNDSYTFMSSFDENTPKTEYFRYEAATVNWLSNLAYDYGDIDGVFAYYENMDLLLFRGSGSGINRDVHEYIGEHLDSERLNYNHMSVTKIADEYFLLYVKAYGDFTGGCWIPLDEFMKKLGLAKDTLLGTVYIIDSESNNTLTDMELNEALKESGIADKRIEAAGEAYHNQSILSRNEDYSIGMLIPGNSVLRNLPVMIKIFFGLAILSVLLVPRTIYWLQIKIARPLKELEHAMKVISNGESEYRIPLEKKRDNDEFYRLMERFNQMMDELNELEISLYKTKIKEQRTQLKYISQQIRPHFILNALNIIYTYNISEFHLVKKMVLYLTKYFRYIVNLQVDFVELEKEFHHVETYLAIQKERYLDRLGYFVEWENQLKECMIPPLIIQTFVENCIKYAIKNDEKLTIFVLAQEVDGKVKLTVADTGHGFPEEVLEKIHAYIDTRVYQDDLGVGIQNAIERMDILYQERVELSIRNAPTGGAVVEICLPLELELFGGK